MEFQPRLKSGVATFLLAPTDGKFLKKVSSETRLPRCGLVASRMNSSVVSERIADFRRASLAEVLPRVLGVPSRASTNEGFLPLALFTGL